MIIENKFKNISKLISNTPLVEIFYKYRGRENRVFAKLEYYNLTGSIKDRMSYYMLKNAYESGKLKKGMTVVEATSGNAGISLSAMCAMLGYSIDIFIPNWLSKERINILKGYGANLHFKTLEEGGFLRCVEDSKEFANLENGFLTKQFDNENNVIAHEISTAKEIISIAQNMQIKPTAFTVGFGTGGTIMGACRGIKKVYKDCKFHPIEEKNSPILSTGKSWGRHRIQGISYDFVPSILKLNELDSVVGIEDGDAIIATQKLSKELGIGVGISSGANLLGAIVLNQKYGNDSNIFTVFADDNKKYLTSDLTKTEPIKKDFISPDIELIDYKIIQII